MPAGAAGSVHKTNWRFYGSLCAQRGLDRALPWQAEGEDPYILSHADPANAPAQSNFAYAATCFMDPPI